MSLLNRRASGAKTKVVEVDRNQKVHPVEPTSDVKKQPRPANLKPDPHNAEKADVITDGEGG